VACIGLVVLLVLSDYCAVSFGVIFKIKYSEVVTTQNFLSFESMTTDESIRMEGLHQSDTEEHKTTRPLSLM